MSEETRNQTDIAASEVGRILPQATELIEKKKYKEALTKLEMACRLQPESVDLLHNTALLSAQCGQFAKAERYFKKASSQVAENCDILHNLALLYVTHSQYDRAAAVFERILAFTPDNPQVLNDLALVQTAQNKLESAQSCYEKAVTQPDCLEKTFFNYFDFCLDNQFYKEGFASCELFAQR